MNQKLLKTLACTLPVLAAAPAANAAILTVNDLGPVTGMTGWTAFKVSATASLPAYGNATVVDLSSNGQGIFGPMHQRWTFIVDEETEAKIHTASPQDASVSPTTGLARYDSHFLFVSSQLLGSTSTPTENNNFVNQVGGPNDSTSSDYGLGTQLTATVGFLPAFQAPTIDIAYLVVRDGDSVSVSGNLANAIGTKDFFSGTVAIPEPASLAMLGLGALGLVRRRRA